MATALALIAAGIFAFSTVLQQRGGLKAPPISIRHPSSFVHLAGQSTWLIGMALLIPGWLLQAMALDRGRVAVIQPIFTMTIVFVLPLGWWLTAQTITAKQVLEACVVVAGLSLFIVFGDPGGGRTSAPNWEWLAAIAAVVVLCAVLLPLGGKERPSLRAGAYGTVAGVLSGLAATVTRPTLELLHTGGGGGVLGNWMVYVVGVAGLLGVLLQQVAPCLLARSTSASARSPPSATGTTRPAPTLGTRSRSPRRSSVRSTWSRSSRRSSAASSRATSGLRRHGPGMKSQGSAQTGV